MHSLGEKGVSHDDPACEDDQSRQEEADQALPTNPKLLIMMMVIIIMMIKLWHPKAVSKLIKFVFITFFILQKSAKNSVQYILQRDEALAVLAGHLFFDCLVKPILCISIIIIIMIAMMIMIHQTRAVWLGPEQLPNRCQSLAQRSHRVHTEKHED